MNNKNIKFYKLNESRTTITFNNINKAKKETKPYKSIIRNTIILSFTFVMIAGGFGLYENSKVNKLAAAVNKSKKIDVEKTNNKSDSLKVVNVDYDKKYEILINKANPLSKDIISSYKQTKVKNNAYPNIKIEYNTYKNYLNLKKAVRKRGYYLNIKNGFNNKGISEHNVGLAIDIVISKSKTSLNNNYKSDEYKYLENIAYLYGFIIRYPKGKENITGYNYEPYHLRYVGKSLAKYLTKNDLTLEEYYDSKE